MEARVPRSARPRYPVVMRADILWVPVCRSAEGVPAPGTRAVRLDVIECGSLKQTGGVSSSASSSTRRRSRSGCRAWAGKSRRPTLMAICWSGLLKGSFIFLSDLSGGSTGRCSRFSRRVELRRRNGVERERAAGV